MREKEDGFYVKVLKKSIEMQKKFLAENPTVKINEVIANLIYKKAYDEVMGQLELSL